MKKIVKKNFRPRRDFELNAEGYKAFRNQGWNGEYEEIVIEYEDNTNARQVENYMRGGSSSKCYEPVRIVKKY